MTAVAIRPVTTDDADWIKQFTAEYWGDTVVVSRGVIRDPQQLPGFVATQGDERIGLASYHSVAADCELVTLASIRPGAGVGTALIDAVKARASQAGCRRLWLITTNDNLNALRFYQKRGFVLVAVHRDAVTRARQLKPAIPLIGADGIPLRDEIELELLLEHHNEDIASAGEQHI
ncbi:MAG: GNAT family N-acetyltransferase [Chloroflexales bacterium]|nr:GNAT family N-acetyltransferase [Chloroflexales bacterium]